MATILGAITVRNAQILSVGSDPSAGAGTVAPRGSMGLQSTGGLWLKNGSADTAWVLLLTSLGPAFGLPATLAVDNDSGANDIVMRPAQFIKGFDGTGGGGHLNLSGGAGSTSQPSGDMNLTTGPSLSGTRNAGDIRIATGNASSFAGGSQGGDIFITSGSVLGGNGRAGNINILGGFTQFGVGLPAGGAILIEAGFNNTGGAQGSRAELRGGRGGSLTTTRAGPAWLIGGRQDNNVEDGGRAIVIGGRVLTAGGVGQGGTAEVDGGQGSGPGGDVEITGGRPGTVNDNSGNILLQIPFAGGTSGTTGNILLQVLPAAGTGNSGNITLSVNAASGIGNSGVIRFTSGVGEDEPLLTYSTATATGNTVNVHVGESDPSLGAGIPSLVGSTFHRNSGGANTVGQFWFKTGPLDTDWTQIV